MATNPINAAYIELAKAIVTQAVYDYRRFLSSRRAQMTDSGIVNPITARKIHELEEFFDSDYCDLLCGFDGTIIKSYILAHPASLEVA